MLDVFNMSGCFIFGKLQQHTILVICKADGPQIETHFKLHFSTNVILHKGYWEPKCSSM
jgi:hypothetical protein